MLFLWLLLIIGIVWYVRSVWPVKGLSYVDARAVREAAKTTGHKLLDVRDAYDFQQCHVQGAINISLGRLPFVWKKDISTGDSVVILSDSMRKSRKAARILRRNGFYNLQAVRGYYCNTMAP